jgi:hypothetical protein
MQWLAGVSLDPLGTVDFLVGLNQRLQADIGYLVRMEPGVQTCEQTFELGCGSCRDSGWLLVQILRHLGLAARFVSGYLVQLKADVDALDGPSGTKVDFTDLHAWAEVYLPGGGWVGLDPTSGLFAGEGHIPLACTPEPASAAAITGATSPANAQFSYANVVERVHEDPRVTKPYDDAAWQKILKLGDKVERQFQRRDVRLTMGGEPTFVSIDDMEGPEWNYTALSPKKRELAGELLRRLRERFAPDSLLHVGQGKWYPGEPLPRWALSMYWRTDGLPMAANPTIVVDERPSRASAAGDALALARATAAELGLPRERIVAGYEDIAHYLVRENRLPVNVDPDDAKLDDPLERARLARLFATGLGKPAGYALPLKWRDQRDGGRFVSSPWPFRAGFMALLPGDSPMGFSLPLAALPWVPPEEREIELPRDPFDEPQPLGNPVAAGGPDPVGPDA